MDTCANCGDPIIRLGDHRRSNLWCHDGITGKPANIRCDRLPTIRLRKPQPDGAPIATPSPSQAQINQALTELQEWISD